MSCLIWTPLKLVSPGTNFSEIFGPTLKKFVPTTGQPHERKSVTTKDVSGVHGCISRTAFHEYASAAPRSVQNMRSSQTLHNVHGN